MRAAKGASESGWVWLTRSALLLALALVVARACMIEYFRESFTTVPGSQPLPRGAGIVPSLVLDLLCCVPALLVLARRAFDGAFRLRLSWAQFFIGLLGMLATASALWADDRFEAAVSGFHLLGAAALFFAASQLIHSWQRLHLIAAVCYGLLIVFVANGLYYRLVDLPDLRHTWQQDRARILRERGWEEGSYVAIQFGKRIENGEMIGFNTSPNSYAAAIVLLSTISVGLLIQRQARRDGLAWLIPFVIVLPVAGWVLYHTRSKGAAGSVALALLMLVGTGALQRWLAEHSRIAYAAGAAVLLAIVVGAAGYGLRNHSLPSDSLNFRWKYWVGSARMFAEHPWLGVGWSNFGQHYLAHRLPEAPEEIKDPHNFIVRFFVELGTVGGTLALAWLAVLWWRLTRPIVPLGESKDERESGAPVMRLLGVAGLALLINILASVDLGESAAFVFVEIIKRAMFLCLLFIGTTAVALRSFERQEIDDRPALWVLHAMLIAVGLFLIHNLIEFSLFETGSMFLFMFLAGSALGMRLDEAEKSSEAQSPRAVAAVGALAWLAAGVLVAPVVWAEQMAQDANADVRRGRLDQAWQQFARAFELVPFNSDYAFRAARAAAWARQQAAQVMPMYQRAIAANPSAVEYYLARARYVMEQGAFDRPQIRADYEKALTLNPNDVEVRLEFAGILAQFGVKSEAIEQYRLALHYNDLLSADEPKRLTPARVAQVKRAIQELSS